MGYVENVPCPLGRSWLMGNSPGQCLRPIRLALQSLG